MSIIQILIVTWNKTFSIWRFYEATPTLTWPTWTCWPPPSSPQRSASCPTVNIQELSAWEWKSLDADMRMPLFHTKHLLVSFLLALIRAKGMDGTTCAVVNQLSHWVLIKWNYGLQQGWPDFLCVPGNLFYWQNFNMKCIYTKTQIYARK